jgi:hypothetical protein
MVPVAQMDVNTEMVPVAQMEVNTERIRINGAQKQCIHLRLMMRVSRTSAICTPHNSKVLASSIFFPIIQHLLSSQSTFFLSEKKKVTEVASQALNAMQ